MMTSQDIIALVVIISYFVLTGILGITISTKAKIGNETKRKILHSFGFLSYPIFLFLFDSWIIASITALSLGIGSFILISILEKYKPDFLLFFKERHKGEMKTTILIIFFVFTLTLIASWGCLYTSLLGLLAIYSWGFGDMFAALIGKRFGKHHFKIQILSKKTIEGTIACFVSIYLVSMIILFIYQWSPLISLLFPLLLASGGALIELLSIDGLDSFFMPVGLFLFSLLLYVI